MSSELLTYDPLETRLDALRDTTLPGIRPEDLAEPAAARILLHNHTVALVEIGKLERELATIRDANGKLRDDCENIRIEANTTLQRANLLLLEVPASFVGGIAIELLVRDTKDGLAWVFLILSLFIVLGLRQSELSAKVKSLIRRKVENHA